MMRRDAAASRAGSLISYKTDLTDRVILVSDADVSLDSAALSPDTNRLVFGRFSEEAPYFEPWIKDLKTKGEFKIDLKDPEFSFHSVAWSPDGAWLVFVGMNHRKLADGTLVSGVTRKILLASADGKTVIVPPIPFYGVMSIDWR